MINSWRNLSLCIIVTQLFMCFTHNALVGVIIQPTRSNLFKRKKKKKELKSEVKKNPFTITWIGTNECRETGCRKGIRKNVARWIHLLSLHFFKTINFPTLTVTVHWILFHLSYIRQATNTSMGWWFLAVYNVYVGNMYTENAHSNPVLVTFCHLMVFDVLMSQKKHRKMKRLTERGFTLSQDINSYSDLVEETDEEKGMRILPPCFSFHKL